MANPQFESAEEVREVMDKIFALMDADPEMGPKLRDAERPQRFEFADFDVVVNIRAARERRGGQPPLGVDATTSTGSRRCG